MKSNLPTNLSDRGGLRRLSSYFNPKKMLTSFVLGKLGLGWLNPFIGLASFLFPDFGSNLGEDNREFYTKEVLSGKNKGKMKNLGFEGYMRKRLAGKIDAYGNEIVKGEHPDKNIMQASIEKFRPTQSQHDQVTEVMRKRQVLLEHARTGQLNEKGEKTLQQMDQLISQYQVDPESIFRT